MHISFYGPVHGTSVGAGRGGRDGGIIYLLLFLPNSHVTRSVHACLQRALACITLACIISENWRSGVGKLGL